MRLAVTFGAISCLAFVAGCGGDDTAASPTQGSAVITCDGSGSGTAVAIADFAFSPASANVAPNGFVTWTNSDSTTSTVTFDNGPIAAL